MATIKAIDFSFSTRESATDRLHVLTIQVNLLLNGVNRLTFQLVWFQLLTKKIAYYSGVD